MGILVNSGFKLVNVIWFLSPKEKHVVNDVYTVTDHCEVNIALPHAVVSNCAEVFFRSH